MNTALKEIAKRSKSYEDADFLDVIFDKYRAQVLRGSVQVVLYGAGSAGKELCPLFKIHGVNPACFCDGNPLRAGESYCGLPVISVDELRRSHMESLIVVATGAHREQVRKQLTDSGFNEEKILAIENQDAMYYYTHVAQWYWPEEDLLAHEAELLEVYNLLSDDKSKEIFASRIALFAGGADFRSFRKFITEYSDIPRLRGGVSHENVTSINDGIEAYLQFNNDVIHLQDGEVFVDGGAFTGDSTMEFIKAIAEKKMTYKKIICFEPDPKIFADLIKNTAQCANVSSRPFGLWSHSTTLRFADSNVLAPGSTRIVSAGEINNNLSCAETGMTEIATTSIDSEFPDERITIIKMDIEGAEVEALHGAEKTIKRCGPKLIISVYHKRNDLFEIPLLIHRMMPSCKMYFRHFGSNFNETTLFAVP